MHSWYAHVFTTDAGPHIRHSLDHEYCCRTAVLSTVNDLRTDYTSLPPCLVEVCTLKSVFTFSSVPNKR